jgi:acetylornithine deacetylase/succinyl-diaminopimelate desuccinylase-like protein
MALDTSMADKVLRHIDATELAQLGCSLVDIPSATGHEIDVAEFILGWYADHGIRPVRQEVEPGRPNAVGILKGTGQGLSLMFNGHMDTSFTGTDEDRLITTVDSGEDLSGRIVDGKVRGLGISNMKGGLASFLIAANAIVKSGVKLKGDLVLAAVVGEISRTPIGPYQGSEYRGEGIGTRHLLTHGVQSDYAVVADGSDLNIIWTQNGVVDLKITVFGQAKSAWSSDRATEPSIDMNAVVKMAKVIDALEVWGARYEIENIYEASTGPMLPKVNVGAIEGGAPYKPNYFPGVCSIYLDVRIPPHIKPVSVQYEVADVLADLGFEYDIEVYRTLRGYEGVGVEPLVQSINDVHVHLFGTKPEPENPRRASIWTDTNAYNELGIPAVKIGPRGKHVGGRVEEIKIEDMVKAAKIYALVALDICSQARLGGNGSAP